ncbi:MULTISPECIES: DUF1284 domain-containing protein [Alphaproteobacteria]|uniref:DUF1284 domain-containing protein n=1 Tax=Alphaproteobacteria TaxID=28211 RepID=UPI001D0A1EE6|nr:MULTISPECIES: DUF1284 domain-containing protein [Alphaproteobacteria]
MTVRLRPHHLLCILTYVGKGYSPGFTANMTRIAGRLSAGEEVEIVAGPDDICIPLLTDPDPHCHRTSVTGRDKAAARELSLSLNLRIKTGAKLVLDADLLSRLRKAFASNRVRSACTGCEWIELCGSMSARRFDGAVLTTGLLRPNRHIE